MHYETGDWRGYKWKASHAFIIGHAASGIVDGPAEVWLHETTAAQGCVRRAISVYGTVYFEVDGPTMDADMWLPEEEIICILGEQ